MGKQKKDGTVQFEATIAQVKTMTDGGIRIALDIVENETETARAVMDFRRLSVILHVVILPVKSNEV